MSSGKFQTTTAGNIYDRRTEKSAMIIYSLCNSQNPPLNWLFVVLHLRKAKSYFPL